MKVRATLRLKNELFVKAREDLGLTQGGLAEVAGVGIGAVNVIENLKLKDYNTNSQAVCRLAEVLGLLPEEIAPPKLCGHAFQTKYERVGSVMPEALLECGLNYTTRMLMPSPAIEAENEDSKEYFNKLIQKFLKRLSYCEKEVLAMRYGLGEKPSLTLQEVGEVLKTSGQNIRLIEVKAIRKMQHLFEVDTRLKDITEQDFLETE